MTGTETALAISLATVAFEKLPYFMVFMIVAIALITFSLRQIGKSLEKLEGCIVGRSFCDERSGAITKSVDELTQRFDNHIAQGHE